MPEAPYIDIDFWNAAQIGVPTAGLTDGQMADFFLRASVLAENYANATWEPTEYLEQHDWRPSRRVYVYNWPVMAITALNVQVGPNKNFTLDPATNMYINNFGRYIELSFLSIAVGISPDLVALGIEPVVNITYTAGYTIPPRDVRDAVAIIAGSLICQHQMALEGVAGAMSFTIGSYMITVARGRSPNIQDEVAGFASYVPLPAQNLLKAYRVTVLR